jgi:hypothetical protein
VPVDPDQKTWLADLVDETLASYDPAAALLRIPPELRAADPEGPDLEARSRTLLVRSMRRKLLDPATAPGEDPFLGPVQGHLGLVLDIALVHGIPFDPERRRGELAALFAALVGSIDLARAAQPGKAGPAPAAAVRKAFVRAGADLKARGTPPGDPKHGLPLRVGVLCLERRHLALLAMTYYAAGRLDATQARRLFDQASTDTVLLVEALSALAVATGPLPALRRRIALAQVGQLGLPREWARDARVAVKAPRAPAQLARACPPRLRAFLAEQLLVSELASGEPSPQRADAVRAFAEGASIPPDQVAALQADAAELFAQQRWLDTGPLATEEWQELADDWEEVADEMVEKVAAVLTDNLDAITTEIRRTGELGQLLAKASSGKTLTADEKRKVKLQLIDLAKAVPALAIFAAPGGMLLLPLLAKLLPFSILPSAWDEKRNGDRPPRPGKD